MKNFFFVSYRFLARTLLLTMISGFLASSSVFSVVEAASPDPCLDIEMSGQQVLNGGIANSGVLNFDNAAVGPSAQYAGCVVDADSDGIGPFQVQGWVWDTNLGWVSLFCSGGLNMGLPCGSQDYGVTIDGPEAGDAFGTLHGHAWGDNTGWISFNCANNNSCGSSNYYVQPEATGPQCLGKVYANQVSCNPPTHLPESVFGWSDNVGWLDLTEVVFPLSSLLNNSKVNVTLKITPDPALAFIKKNIAPLADGKSAYDMELVITDQNNLPIDPKDYVITGQVIWQDTVDLDQTNNSIPAPGNYSSCTNCGAVSKPLDFADFTFDAGSNSFKAQVTAIAPTSTMNGYDGLLDSTGFHGGSGTIVFPYENFILPSTNPVGSGGIPPNNLILSSVNLSVKKGAACAFGTGAGCVSQQVPFPNGVGSVPLSFSPAAEVADLNVNNKDYFSAQYNVATTFNAGGFCSSNIDCSKVTADFQMGIDDAATPFQFVDDANHNNNFFSYPLSQLPASFQAVPILLPPNTQADAQVDNPYIYSTISYTLNGKDVSYYSNKLPRVTGTFIANPVATVRGNVYSTGVTNAQAGNTIRSLGDVSTNILRDTIFRNVSNIIAGSPTPKNAALIGDYNTNSGFVVKDPSTVTTLLPDSTTPFPIPRAYYFKGDVTIDVGGINNNTLNFAGQRTIIVNGGNVYINSNLYNAPGTTTPKPRLGIIVLKDLKNSQGGHVYIAPNVTNIQANIFADGTIFSYDGDTKNINALSGEPIFVSEQKRHDALSNQLYIQGSMASLNTIGGATATVPILGDGRKETSVEGQYGNTPSGRSHARLYDLNFLRYYGPTFERDAQGNAVDQQDPADGIVAKLVQDGGDLIPPAAGSASTALGLDPGNFNAVYIYFDPPTAALPGFGTYGSLNLKQLRQ